jgi:hypothetical protein
MTPLEKILERLPSARKSGNGWSAQCPVHEDRRASLSVSQADDGKVLLHCHAGCATSTIVAALDLKSADLFPTKADVPQVIRNKKPGRTFPCWEAAVEALERQYGKRTGLWMYEDAEGEYVGAVLRWDRPNGKEIRPIARGAIGGLSKRCQSRVLFTICPNCCRLSGCSSSKAKTA